MLFAVSKARFRYIWADNLWIQKDSINVFRATKTSFEWLGVLKHG